jgi:alpha-L-arabinofuranosidase
MMIAQRNEQSQLQIDYSLSTFSIHLCVFFLSRKEFHSFAVGELQINYYQREEEVRLDLSGIGVKKKAVLNVLTGSAPDEMNDFDNPDRIKLIKKELDNCSTEMLLKLDPMSANVIEFSLESGL